MKKFIPLFLIILLISCSTQKETIDKKAINTTEFLKDPFGFDETIKNFTNLSTIKFKTQKFVRENKHYPEQTDTVIKLTYKKSELFFYKSHIGKEFLLAGKILNKQIELKNGIQVGVSKEEFKNTFTENLVIRSDSIQITGEGTKYTFLFQKDKLYRINIDNYFD